MLHGVSGLLLFLDSVGRCVDEKINIIGSFRDCLF